MRKNSPSRIFVKSIDSLALITLIVISFLFNACQKDFNKSDPNKSNIESQKISPDVAEDCLPGYHWDPILRRCVKDDITSTYAGVSITYQVNNNILVFNSVNDVNTVINQLDADYDTYNDNYDNQYPNYTADQLDSIDVINNFDEFKKLKDFENLFSGYSSKRKQIENTETTWLLNNFTGTDPDTLDYTFDDAENTIFNANYSFKVGTAIYEFRSDGFYINGVLQAGTETNGPTGPAGPLGPTVCKSNKKLKTPSPEFENGTRIFYLKVAIHSIAVRSGVHGKVVHYKKKNGSWKRKRAEMAVGCAGTIYDGSCTYLFQFTDRKPFSGYSKRKQLATRRHTAAQPNAIIWKTYSGEVASSFSTPNTSIAGTLPLTF